MANILCIPARFDPRRVGVDRYPDLLQSVPWLRDIGKAHRSDRQVLRVRRWEDVPSSDARGVMSMLSEHSEWRHEWIGDRFDGEVASYWDRVERSVANLAWERVEYQEREPADYPPNAAAQTAGWVAASIGICLKVGVEVPRNALRQWAWYVRGHWPCAYEDGVESPAYGVAGIPRDSARLVVF